MLLVTLKSQIERVLDDVSILVVSQASSPAAEVRCDSPLQKRKGDVG